MTQQNRNTVLVQLFVMASLRLLPLCCLVLGFRITEAVVDCTTAGSVRLVGWSHDGAGRIEVCLNGAWGTICADGLDTPWSEKNAQVACRALGYSGALNSILHNTMPESRRVTAFSYPIHLSQVRCTGGEKSLLNCTHGAGTGCDHRRDAAIVCRKRETSGHVRLVGDVRNEVGAVELLHPQVGWTGICADEGNAHLWESNTDAAEIVCRQLGYEGGRPYVNSANFQRSRVVVQQCDSKDQFSLVQCSTSVLMSNCTSDMMGWVQCSLNDGFNGNAERVGTDREGIVELQYNGRWGYICDTSWDSVDAEVACVEFNKDNSVTNYDTNPEGDYSKYISDLKPLWVTDVKCTTTTTQTDDGTETTVDQNDVIDCDISAAFPVGYTDCNFAYTTDRVALVDCGSVVTTGYILGIVLGVGIPLLLCCICPCVVMLCVKAKRSDFDCCDCICSCTASTVVYICSAVSALGHCICYPFRHRRTLRFRQSQSNTPATETTTNTTSFTEPQSQPQPSDTDTDLTKAPPPSYSDAISYTTVITAATDVKTSPPPPTYDNEEPLVLPAPEPL